MVEKPEKSEPISKTLYLTDYQLMIADVPNWLSRAMVSWVLAALTRVLILSMKRTL